jgi:RNA polymerase sigma-70 factor, ECF subfamily
MHPIGRSSILDGWKGPAVPTELDSPAHSADLLLASACARGEADAIARFEREFLGNVPAFVAHISTDPVFLDDLLQRLRVRLFVALPGKASRIADYQGRGPLGGWLRVTAVRAALDLKREQPRLDERVDAQAVPRDVELDLARRRDGGAFKEAVTDALASLEAEERTILRLRYVDGLTVEKIGVIYGVHASTIVRKLTASRERVGLRVRQALFARQKLQGEDIAALAAQVESQLDLSLSRILGKAPT